MYSWDEGAVNHEKAGDIYAVALMSPAQEGNRRHLNYDPVRRLLPNNARKRVIASYKSVKANLSR